MQLFSNKNIVLIPSFLEVIQNPSMPLIQIKQNWYSVLGSKKDMVTEVERGVKKRLDRRNWRTEPRVRETIHTLC